MAIHPNKSRWFGAFDWRRDFSGKSNYDAFATEEDFIASLKGVRLQRYLKRREIRYQKWINGPMYQRSLRVTRIKLKKLEKQKQTLLNKRFKAKKLKDATIPAEAIAAIALATFIKGN